MQGLVDEAGLRRMTRLLTGAVVLMLLGGAAVSGAASPLLGPNIRITGAATTEYNPEVAWSSKAEEFLVVWEYYRNDAARGWDIYGRRVGTDGTRVGPSVRISGVSAVSNEYNPAVTWSDSAGAYLVVWEDMRNDATRGWDIYGQLVGADGVPVAPNFRISSPAATTDQYEPAVVSNPAANEYLVVWEDTRDTGTRGADIYGQRLAADGSRIGGDFRISGVAATANEGEPAVAWSQDTDSYLVVWQDARDAPPCGYGIYGQRLAADGSRVGGNFRMSGVAVVSGESAPAVAWNQYAGAYLAVWADIRNEATRGWDIYGQRLGGNGALAGGNFRISGAAATSNEYNPAVASNETGGGYLVVWQDERSYATRGVDVYGQHLGGNGGLDGSNFLISRAATNEYAPVLAWDQVANQYLVVWDDERNHATRWTDIYGQRLTG